MTDSSAHLGAAPDARHADRLAAAAWVLAVFAGFAWAFYLLVVTQFSGDDTAYVLLVAAVVCTAASSTSAVCACVKHAERRLLAALGR